jgi:hypothetical protein
MVKITIERSRWGNGDNHQGGALRTMSGKQCCLGFACEQAGIEPRVYQGYPHEALAPTLRRLEDVPELLRPFVAAGAIDEFPLRRSELARDLAMINDDKIEYTSLESRERALSHRAAADGVEMVFVD